jgi:gliding motility-associated-like protein
MLFAKKHFSPMTLFYYREKFGKINFIICIFFLQLFCMKGFAQNQTQNWHFGSGAGISFSTSPPSLIPSFMSTNETCASISDAAGNLLFYTDGCRVWNQTGAFMAGGGTFGPPFPLFGSGSSSQGSVIVKQPGNNTIYFIFTLSTVASTVGLRYSTVDMSLAAGLGSVTVLNTLVYSGPSHEYLTSVRHCNGVDVWVISKDYATNNFRAYLVTASGVSTIPVISTGVGTVNSSSPFTDGQLKASPNGKKLANAFMFNTPYTSGFELYDFSPSTGIVSNPVLLTIPTNTLLQSSCYGCEFSPDGTKLYGSNSIAGPNPLPQPDPDLDPDLFFNYNPSFSEIYQWDLCAGSSAAIAASRTTVGTDTTAVYAMQLGPDGRIYVATSIFAPIFSSLWPSLGLGVVNNPNSLGIACSYTPYGLFIPTIPLVQSIFGLPSFMSSYFLGTPPPSTLAFTHTTSINSCVTVSFTPPPITVLSNTVLSPCPNAVTNYSINSLLWLFGDPASGAANTSTLANPTHVFSSQSTYTVKLVLNYDCSSDTISEVIVLGGSNFAPTSNAPLCSGNTLSLTIGGSGPYTWTGPNSFSSTVQNPVIPNVQLINAGTYSVSSSCVSLATLNVVVFPTPTVSILPSGPNPLCAGQSLTLSAVGANNYIWLPSGVNTSSIVINPSVASTYSLIGSTSISNCTNSTVITVTVVPSPSITITPAPPICAGNTLSITANITDPYVWSGPSFYTSNNQNPLINNAQTFNSGIYAVISTNTVGCSTTATINALVVPIPTVNVLAFGNNPLCAGQSINLVGNGASTYTWLNNGSTVTSITVTPSTTTTYTLIGLSAAGNCSNTGVWTVTVNPLPVVTPTANTPICVGKTLSLTVTSGLTYQWFGPNLFSSTLQNPSIGNASINNSGTYSVIVTGLNTCTAITSVSVNVIPSPSITVSSTPACENQTLSLFANAGAGATYTWSGIGGFTSNLQNPVINNVNLSQSGLYTVTVTSTPGCTNSAVVNALVVPPPLPIATLSGNGTLCAQALNGSPNTITLTSSGANTYTLSTPAYIANSNPSGSGNVNPLFTIPPFQNITTIATATLVGSNGVCTNSNTATFTIIPNPVVSISSPSPVICAGQSFTYTSNGANSYTWGPNTPGLTTYISPITVASPTVTSVYSIIGGSLGCNSGTQTSTLTVNPLPVLNPSSGSVCIGSAITLSAGGTAVNFTWSPNIGLSSTNGSTVNASPTSNQLYNIIGEANTCTASAQTWVYVLPLPQPSIRISNPILCLNETTSLQGSGLGSNLSYEWLGPGGRTYQGQNINLLAFNMEFAGTYTLVITDDKGCKNRTTTALNIKPLPSGNLSGNTQGCVPLCTKLTFSSNSPSTTATWQFNQQTLNLSSKNCFNTVGNQIVTGYLYDAITSCSNIITKNINVYEKPKADFDYTPNKPVEGFDEVNFNSTSKGENLSNYTWYVSANIPIYNNTGYQADTKSTNYLFDKAGTYAIALVVKNTLGCVDTAIKSIRVEPDFNIYMPNSFTPNEDDRNETFHAKGTGIKTFKLNIFNRWGELVFESNDITKGWDGSFKGQPCQSDVYVWKLRATDVNGKPRELNGHVTLYR